MEIEEILDTYIAGMSQLHTIQCDMRDLANTRLQELNDFEEKQSEKGNDALKQNIYNNWLVARNPYTGKQEKIVPSKRSVEDLKLSLFRHKNKQYQWLLAEAYELFEDCLEMLYAYAGYKNTDLWPLQDFGAVKLSELNSKRYEFFHVQAKNKRKAPASIINAFRNTYSEIKNHERDNQLCSDLYLAINLAESLRHIIVHLGGTVNDKEAFVKLVLEKSGLYNSNNPSEGNLHFINGYFGINKYENTIVLTERSINSDLPLPMHVDVLGETCSYLLGYIRILGDSLKQDESLSDA